MKQPLKLAAAIRASDTTITLNQDVRRKRPFHIAVLVDRGENPRSLYMLEMMQLQRIRKATYVATRAIGGTFASAHPCNTEVALVK